MSFKNWAQPFLGCWIVLKKPEEHEKPRRASQSMLGSYSNFPAMVHKTAIFANSVSNKKIQQVLTQILLRLNKQELGPQETKNSPMLQCTAKLEFGVAEAGNFNYLDIEEASRLAEAINRKTFRVMDFFCAVQYHKTREGEEVPLKFDYYIMRFIFNEATIEIRIFHEKGPRHIAPEDVIDIITDKINETAKKKMLKIIDSY